jgi:hypothetical protein
VEEERTWFGPAVDLWVLAAAVGELTLARPRAGKRDPGPLPCCRDYMRLLGGCTVVCSPAPPSTIIQPDAECQHTHTVRWLCGRGGEHSGRHDSFALLCFALLCSALLCFALLCSALHNEAGHIRLLAFVARTHWLAQLLDFGLLAPPHPAAR